MDRKRSLILSAVVAGSAFAGGAAFAATTFVAQPSAGAQSPTEEVAFDAPTTSVEDAGQRPTWVLLQEPAPELPTTVAQPPSAVPEVATTAQTTDDSPVRSTNVSVAHHREHDDDDEREDEREHEEEHEEEEEHGEHGDD
ncbi:MAG TPA: hypothetical protein VF855_01425 [Acidimicrobiales bacterium]